MKRLCSFLTAMLLIPCLCAGVQAAASAQIVRAFVSEGCLYTYVDLSGNEQPITKAEASVLLDRMLQVTDASVTTLFPDLDATPDWAYQAAVNLETVGVLQTAADGSLGLSDTLTRAEAADMLCGALEVLEAREPGGWLLW